MKTETAQAKVKKTRGKTQVDVTDTLPDGSLIDLKDEKTWEGLKLNTRQKLFVIWYTTPNQDGFQRSLVAALKAGYPRKTAYQAKLKIMTAPGVQSMIEKITKQQHIISLKEAANQLTQEKIKRATYDIADFYITEEYETKAGNVRRKATAKPIEEIEETKRTLIESVEYSSNGEVIYKLPSKEKEINDVIKMANDLEKNTNSSEYDVETTVDMVRDNLAMVKTNIRIKNKKLKETAENYIENGENQPDFD